MFAYQYQGLHFFGLLSVEFIINNVIHTSRNRGNFWKNDKRKKKRIKQGRTDVYHRKDRKQDLKVLAIFFFCILCPVKH